MAANGLREPGGASLFPVETGDEVAGLAFELGVFPFGPLAGAPDELAGAGKGADVLIQVDPGEAAALDPGMVFFPVANPFVGNGGGGGAALRELMEGGLVVLEAWQVVAAVAGDDKRCFFGC